MRLNSIFVVAMAIAMFAGLMVSALDSQALAVKGDKSKQYCYTTIAAYDYDTDQCFSSKDGCQQAQTADPYAISKCKKDSRP